MDHYTESIKTWWRVVQQFQEFYTVSAGFGVLQVAAYALACRA